MKKIFLLVLLSLVAGGFLIAESANYRNYSELKELLDSDADDYLLLDVRTAGEFSQAHIPGAVNIPYDELPDALPKGTAKDKLIIVYCRSGNRSGTARRILSKAGYTNLHDFGGISRWKGEFE